MYNYNINDYIVNCYADMEMVNFLLNHIPDYENVLVERHHKFVYSYLKYNRSLTMTAAYYDFTEKDMRRIFWRIQRKLLLEFIERVSKDKIKTIKQLPTNFDGFLLWQLQQFRDDAEEISGYIKRKISGYTYKNYNNIDGVSESRRKKIENILNILSRYDNLDKILPESFYVIAKDLLDGKSLTQTVESHNRNLKYIVNSIIGLNKPRNKRERGWLAYLDDYLKKDNNTNCDKVIVFPQ